MQIESSPFNYIIKELKNRKKTPPFYILKFIDYLEDNFKINKKDTINIINTKDIFLERIEQVLKKHINRFFEEENIEYNFD